jgi:hypothetical protein
VVGVAIKEERVGSPEGGGKAFAAMFAFLLKVSCAGEHGEAGGQASGIFGLKGTGG